MVRMSVWKVLVVLILVLSAGSITFAATTVYVDEASFLEAMAPEYYFEDFSSFGLGVVTTPLLLGPVNGFSYSISTSTGWLLYSGGGNISTSNWSTPLVLTFTGDPVFAVGGNFWLTYIDFNTATGVLVIDLADGSSTQEILTDATPNTFRGFTSTVAITGLTLTPPFLSMPSLDNPYATMDNLIVGSIPPGTLNVTIEPAGARDAGARWSADGGATWHESDAALTLPTGTYSVIFNSVSGWDTPAAITDVEVNTGVTTRLSGTYIRHTGTLNVTIEPAGVRDAGARWSADGGVTWHESDAALTLSTGTYTVIFKGISGWDKPADITNVSVTMDAVTNRSGTYTRHITALPLTQSDTMNLLPYMILMGLIIGTASVLFYLRRKRLAER